MAQICFWPDGTSYPNASPCNASSTGSHCCGNNDACLESGYCFYQGARRNGIYRGGCTDQNWESAACPYYCQDLRLAGDLSLLMVDDQGDGLWCCGVGFNSSSNMCQYTTHSSNTPFNLPEGRVINNRTSGSSGPNITTSSSIATCSPDPGNQSGYKTSGNDNVAIGVGLGVPLAFSLAALAIMTVLWWRTRKSGTYVAGNDGRLNAAVDVKLYPTAGRQELGGQPLSELSGRHHSEIRT
jgi:hypothetical protein